MPLKNLETYTQLINELDNSDLLYQSLIEYGKQIREDSEIRTRENYINGCQSQVWIVGTLYEDRWVFKFDSDAIIVKGIGKIILDTYNNLTSDEIRSITFHNFKPIAAILSTQRQRGLQSIINKIHSITYTGETQ